MFTNNLPTVQGSVGNIHGGALCPLQETTDMNELERLHIRESLDLVLDYAEGKLELIENDCKNGTIEEYNEYKEALETIESIVLSYSNNELDICMQCGNSKEHCKLIANCNQ